MIIRFSALVLASVVQGDKEVQGGAFDETPPPRSPRPPCYHAEVRDPD
jgi:hypothetical protein